MKFLRRGVHEEQSLFALIDFAKQGNVSGFVETLRDNEYCRLNLNKADSREKENGFTALLWASGAGCIDIVKCIWESTHGVANCVEIERNQSDNNGNNAFQLAALLVGHVTLLEYFYSFKNDPQKTIDFKQRNKHGKTAFLSACFHDRLKIVKWLWESNDNEIVDKTAVDDEGNNAFLIAVSGGAVSVMRFFIERKASQSHFEFDFTAKDSKGQDAFLIAVVNGRSRTCRFLIEEMSDDFGSEKLLSNPNLILIAARLGKEKIVQYLWTVVDDDCKFATTDSGRNAKNVAAGEGHRSCVDFFDSVSFDLLFNMQFKSPTEWSVNEVVAWVSSDKIGLESIASELKQNENCF